MSNFDVNTSTKVRTRTQSGALKSKTASQAPVTKGRALPPTEGTREYVFWAFAQLPQDEQKLFLSSVMNSDSAIDAPDAAAVALDVGRRTSSRESAIPEQSRTKPVQRRDRKTPPEPSIPATPVGSVTAKPCNRTAPDADSPLSLPISKRQQSRLRDQAPVSPMRTNKAPVSSLVSPQWNRQSNKFSALSPAEDADEPNADDEAATGDADEVDTSAPAPAHSHSPDESHPSTPRSSTSTATLLAAGDDDDRSDTDLPRELEDQRADAVTPTRNFSPSYKRGPASLTEDAQASMDAAVTQESARIRRVGYHGGPHILEMLRMSKEKTPLDDVEVMLVAVSTEGIVTAMSADGVQRPLRLFLFHTRMSATATQAKHYELVGAQKGTSKSYLFPHYEPHSSVRDDEQASEAGDQVLSLIKQAVLSKVIEAGRAPAASIEKWKIEFEKTKDTSKEAAAVQVTEVAVNGDCFFDCLRIALDWPIDAQKQTAINVLEANPSVALPILTPLSDRMISSLHVNLTTSASSPPSRHASPRPGHVAEAPSPHRVRSPGELQRMAEIRARGGQVSSLATLGMQSQAKQSQRFIRRRTTVTSSRNRPQASSPTPAKVVDPRGGALWSDALSDDHTGSTKKTKSKNKKTSLDPAPPVPSESDEASNDLTRRKKKDKGTRTVTKSSTKKQKRRTSAEHKASTTHTRSGKNVDSASPPSRWTTRAVVLWNVPKAVGDREELLAEAGNRGFSDDLMTVLSKSETVWKRALRKQELRYFHVVKFSNMEDAQAMVTTWHKKVSRGWSVRPYQKGHGDEQATNKARSPTTSSDMSGASTPARSPVSSTSSSSSSSPAPRLPLSPPLPPLPSPPPSSLSGADVPNSSASSYPPDDLRSVMTELMKSMVLLTAALGTSAVRTASARTVEGVTVSIANDPPVPMNGPLFIPGCGCGLSATTSASGRPPSCRTPGEWANTSIPPLHHFANPCVTATRSAHAPTPPECWYSQSSLPCPYGPSCRYAHLDSRSWPQPWHSGSAPAFGQAQRC